MRGIALLRLYPYEAFRQISDSVFEIYGNTPGSQYAAMFGGLCEKECNYKDQTVAVTRWTR